MSYIGNIPTSATFAIDSFNGDNSTVNFTLREAPVTTSSILVFVGGIRQHTDTYSLSSTTLTFSEAPPTGTNNIQVLFLGLGASPHIPSDSSVSTVKIQTNAITGDKIAVGQITSNLIAANAVTTAAIADGAINTSELAAGAVTGDKIGLTAINANNIVNATITGAKIASATITGDKITAATIGSSNLTSTGVSSGSYGGTGNTVSITVDSQGRITAAANVAANAGSSQWTTTGSDIYYNTGNVGIGTNSPVTYGKFAVRGAITIAAAGQVSGHFSDASTGSFYIAHDTNKISLKADGDLDLFGMNSGDSIIFSTNATERLRIPSDAAGIKFPATQAASTNANTLDDYEEGTFTPTLTGSSGAGSYNNRDGIYVKVGKMVTVNFWVYGSSKNTLSGDITLTGLPFATSTTASYSGYRPTPSLRTMALLSVTGFIGGWSGSGATSINLQINNNGAVSAELNASNLPTSNFEVGGTLSYITD